VKGVHVLPVLSGFFLAWGATKLLSFGSLTIVWLAHEPIGSVLGWAMSLLTITLGSAIGGFLAARQTESRKAGLATGAIVGVLLVLLGLVFVFFPSGTPSWPTWMMALTTVPYIPAAILGARLGSPTGLTSAST
jgi:protein-S-isoprenylcysteine O-methyltransferase Ste14